MIELVQVEQKELFPLTWRALGLVFVVKFSVSATRK